MKELPPFYVGQRVVALKGHSQGFFKKGDEFTIKSIRMGCCRWLVTVGITSTHTHHRCTVCNKTMEKNTSEGLFFAKNFSPIHSDFQAITFEKVLETELTSQN